MMTTFSVGANSWCSRWAWEMRVWRWASTVVALRDVSGMWR
jgi:hypothetical protein